MILLISFKLRIKLIISKMSRYSLLNFLNIYKIVEIELLILISIKLTTSNLLFTNEIKYVKIHFFNIRNNPFYF